MAVTLIKSPIGHKLSDAEIDAVIINNGTGDALVYTGFAHALADGDYVYIESNFESYNGYKYVDSISYDSFKIRDSENSDAVEYVQDADITYRVSVLNHGWQCVHLPIVYELESDLYPNNIAEEAYTPTTIISQSEEGGLTRLALSVGITDPTELSKIKLFGSGDLEGVYQIVTVYEAWNIVIDLPYDSSNDLTSYQIIKYYDNYCINIRVWAGLEPGHTWESRQPIEIAATLQFIPDDENKIKFSISEVLRSYIKTRNNLTLDTLPNNLDFMVAFYIEYFESYDVSDGEEITTFEQGSTTDDFIGHAVNAMLPFKSESISHLSDYVNEDVYLANWLTLQDRPIGIVDRFFDLSFINQYLNYDIKVVIEKSLNGTGIETEVLQLGIIGTGIIRVPFIPETGFDQYCIQAFKVASAGFTPASLTALSSWTNYNDSGPAWAVAVGGTFNGLPVVDTNVLGGNITTDKWYTSYTFVTGNEYSFDYSFHGDSKTFTISILDLSMNVLTYLNVLVASGTVSGTYTFTAPVSAVRISVHFYQAPSCGSGGDFCKGVIMSFTNSTPSIPSTPDLEITERICMDIIEECETTFIQSNDDIRLTEDGNFRILE